MWHVSQEELLTIFPRGAVSDLPWAGPDVVGLVRGEPGFFCLLRTTSSQSPVAPARRGASLCALIRLPTGVVAVDIDQVQACPETVPSPEAPSLACHLDAIVASAFSPVADALPTSPHEADARSTGEKQTFLIVRSGSATLAIPASRVARVGKHEGVYPAGRQVNQWIAKLDQALLACASLGGLEQDDVGPADEPWCIALKDDGESAGLLAAQVAGLLEVDAQQVRHFGEADSASVWLAIPGQAPVKVFGHVERSTPRSSPGSAGRTAEDLPGTMPLAAATRALTLQIAAFRIVVPRGLIREVLGPLADTAVDRRRRRGSLPVIDLRRALGTASPDRRNFALHLDLAGCQFIALVDQGEMSVSAPDFSPLPTLPAALSAWLDGIREVDAHCELRLREDFSRSARKALQRSLPGGSLLGWLPPSS